MKPMFRALFTVIIRMTGTSAATAAELALRPDEMNLLRQGENMIAVAHKTGSDTTKYIDIGIVALHSE